MNKIIKITAVFVLGVLLTNCNGEDGVNGTNGINGEEGIGFDSLLAYGSINAKMEGTRPDGEPFIDESQFSFIPNEGYDFINASVVEISGNEHTFDIGRFVSVPDDYHQEDFIEIQLIVTDLGLSTQTIEHLSIDYDDHFILGDDLKYFIFDDGDLESDDIETSDFSITDLAFDEDTYKLSFSYSMDVTGSGNDTGNDLTLSGSVDVTVFEAVDSGNINQ